MWDVFVKLRFFKIVMDCQVLFHSNCIETSGMVSRQEATNLFTQVHNIWDIYRIVSYWAALRHYLATC